jgi:hypothetical protein
LIYLPSALIPPRWTVASGNDELGDLEVVRVFADPLLATLSRFILPSECDAIIAHGNALGWHPSFTSTYADNVVVDKVRTSSSAYASRNDTVLVPLLQRVAKLVGEPVSHVELGPILKYEVGEYFDEHWDESVAGAFAHPASRGKRAFKLMKLRAHRDCCSHSFLNSPPSYDSPLSVYVSVQWHG